MHTFSLVTGSFETQALPLCRDLTLTVLHPDTRDSSLVEPPTVAQRCPYIMLLCLCSNCFFPPDAFPIQSVRKTHAPGFNLREASSVKPFQTVSLLPHHHPLENRPLLPLGFAVAGPTCYDLVLSPWVRTEI